VTFYVEHFNGLIVRAEVRQRTASDGHSRLICACYEVETAERIAAALNAQAGLVEALDELLDEACNGTAIGPLTNAKARAVLAAVKGV
jgi:recombinational DNA repair protein (RecF pathway)